jgi:N-acetylglutamate synthase-like GNAT family acetyltransferase
MKLTIIRLQHFSDQDRLDLAKIWPAADIKTLENALGEQQQIWAAKFNDRLLAAVQVTIQGTQGELRDLTVREVTRRRGVGCYLLAELLAQNSAITQWWLAEDNVEDRATMTAFMQHGGFSAQAGGWGLAGSE